MLVKSIHKEINGNINGNPFDVIFIDGESEVDEAVGEFLLRLNSVEKVVVEIPDEAKSEGVNLADMTLNDLKAEASKSNIKLGSARTKEEIIAKIEGAE